MNGKSAKLLRKAVSPMMGYRAFKKTGQPSGGDIIIQNSTDKKGNKTIIVGKHYDAVHVNSISNHYRHIKATYKSAPHNEKAELKESAMKNIEKNQNISEKK